MLDQRLPSDAPADVCVVDDEPTIVEVIREVLEDAHIRVKGCPSAWRAHYCIRTQQPKLVILDVSMPQVSGIELFYLLRSDPKTQHIPVLFYTAYPSRLRQELPNLEAMGAELLPKPFDIIDLQQRVVSRLAA